MSRLEWTWYVSNIVVPEFSDGTFVHLWYGPKGVQVSYRFERVAGVRAIFLATLSLPDEYFVVDLPF